MFSALFVNMLKLRNYQKHAINNISSGFLNGEKSGALLWATGSGKSFAIRGIFDNIMSKYTHFIVIVPTNSIKPSFSDNNFNLKINEIDSNTCKKINAYLLSSGGNGIITTHAAFSNIDINFDCSNMILAIDEAHHAGENTKLINVIKKWIDCGGTCLYVTATPTRTNGKSAVHIFNTSEDMISIRSIKDQMEGGFCPSQICCDLVKVESDCFDPGDQVIGAPVDKEKLANHIIEQLSDDCWPKTIIRLKNTGSQLKNKELINYINNRLIESNPNIKTILATRNEDLKKLNNILKSDKNKSSIKESEIDIIIGINAVVEGLDWPNCSHFYFIGIPDSVLLLTQATGRTLRKKVLDDYYPGWTNVSKVTMFTGNVSNIKSNHSSVIMKAICYMGSLRDWSALSIIKEKFNNKLSDDIKDVIKEVNENTSPIAKETLARVQIYFYDNVPSIKRLSRRNIIELYRYLSDAGKVIKKDVCTEGELKAAMVMGDPESKEKFYDKINNIDPEDKDAAVKIKKEWQSVVEQFFDSDELADEYEFGMIQRLNINQQVIEEAIKIVDEPDFWSWLR